MNIKLDKDVRVRLDREDVLKWKSHNFLSQQFKIGQQSFGLELRSEPDAPSSYILAEKELLVIILNQNDSLNLRDSAVPRSGITVCDVNIQIDTWDSDQRKKHDDKIKGA